MKFGFQKFEAMDIDKLREKGCRNISELTAQNICVCLVVVVLLRFIVGIEI